MAADLSTLNRLLIERGAQRIPHVGCDLHAHLTGVSQILTQWGCDDDLRRAGLFHSIYSTSGLSYATVSFEDRSVIAEAIGEHADCLVYAYCRMGDTSFENSVLLRVPVLEDRMTHRPLVVSDREFEGLLWLKLANVVEIESRRDWRELLDSRDTRARNLMVRLGTEAQAHFWRLVARRVGGEGLEAWEHLFGKRMIETGGLTARWGESRVRALLRVWLWRRQMTRVRKVQE